MNFPRLLTIAGSDSGGGAGIEADLKTFTALGCYGMAAITSVTAQNTLGVHDVYDIPPASVSKQIKAVLEDIGADAIKTGMLSNAGIIEAVADALENVRAVKLVVDPVMVSTSGDRLLREDAQASLVERVLPLAHVLTPNIPEAEALSGLVIDSEENLRAAAERIHALGPDYVLVKGGHLQGGEAIDWLYNGSGWRAFTAPRIPTKNTHGTGCTYAAAIASQLGHGNAVEDAVQRAKDYLTGAIQHGFDLGRGHGPVNHLWDLRPGSDESN